MQIRFAAIGGVDVDADLLGSGLKALAERAEFDEVPYAPESTYAIRIHPAWTGNQSAWSVVEIEGENSISTLLEVARVIAVHTKRSINAVASGVERSTTAGRVEVGYRAYEVRPDGASSTFTNDEADEICGEADEDSDDELGDLLSILVGDSAVHTAERSTNSGRCFRRKPIFDDPRLSRLAASILAAKTVNFAPDAKERVRLNLEGHDGTKQISLVSQEEAEQLRKATSR